MFKTNVNMQLVLGYSNQVYELNVLISELKTQKRGVIYYFLLIKQFITLISLKSTIRFH